MSNGDGPVNWIMLAIPTALGGIGAFFHLKSDVRVVRANVKALEDKVGVHYETILRELGDIKGDIKSLVDRQG